MAIVKTQPSSLIIESFIHINYEEDKSHKVLEAIKKRFDTKHQETIFNCFMCDNAKFELDLLHFIVLGFKEPKQLDNINHQFIFRLQALQKELFRHYHKMSGFLRFVELEDKTLYAQVESKFNILYLLGKHFVQRFNNQTFIIHDLKRQLAFVKMDNFIGIQIVDSFEIPICSENEKKFSQLWKTFFESVSIKSRTNSNLQNQMVPFIYRTFMTEFL